MIAKKLRTKLVLAFLLLTTISLLSFIGSIILFSKKTKLDATALLAENCLFLSHEKTKEINRVLSYDIKDDAFFKNGDSKSRQDFFTHHNNLLNDLKKINSSENYTDEEITKSTKAISIHEKELVNSFSRFLETVLEKGYKDFGTEGNMRIHAHALMQCKSLQLQELALMMRRHEKDFIIRKEEEYCRKFVETGEQFRTALKFSNEKNKKELLLDLENYRMLFRKFTELQYLLGVKENEGQLGEMKKERDALDAEYLKLSSHIAVVEKSYEKTFTLYSSLLIGMFIVTALSLTFIYTHQLSKDTIRLNKKITRYVNEKFSNAPVPSEKINVFEIREIDNNLSLLAGELDKYIHSFIEQVNEKTKELEEQKQVLHTKNLEVQRQRDVLIQQKLRLENQKKLLSDQHNNLMESLYCAQRIQNALLPPIEEISAVFSSGFVFYQPRDVVSGDFYWMEKVKTKINATTEAELCGDSFMEIYEPQNEFDEEEKEAILFAVADCTGHGVPGAFMSIMGHGQLAKIVNEFGITDPGEILQSLNKEIVNISRHRMQPRSFLTEGMEIALCKYVPEKNELHYASANSKLIHVRKGVMSELEYSGNSIGGYNPDAIFKTAVLKIKEGDMLYLYSDGYQDQFGGGKNKKFKSASFRELLFAIASLSVKDQQKILNSTFERWKGTNEQIDDVLVMGIRF